MRSSVFGERIYKLTGISFVERTRERRKIKSRAKGRNRVTYYIDRENCNPLWKIHEIELRFKHNGGLVLTNSVRSIILRLIDRLLLIGYSLKLWLI